MNDFQSKYELLIDAYTAARKQLFASIRDETSTTKLFAYGEEIMGPELDIALRFFGKVIELDPKNVTTESSRFDWHAVYQLLVS